MCPKQDAVALGLGADGTRVCEFSTAEEDARRHLAPAVVDFLAGGAGDEVTLRANEQAWSEYQLWPRVMTDVRDTDTSVVFGGHRLAAPLLVSPMGLHRLVTAEAELASAAAARRAGVAYVSSSASSVTLEDVAEVAPDLRWFQLYWLRDRDVVADLVHRAANAGYVGICLTVDAPVGGVRMRDRRNGFTVPEGIRFANLERYGFAPARPSGAAAVRYIVDEVDPSVTWRDIAWLNELSDLPLIVKGVLRPDDTETAVQNGVEAVFVSNHGGRQLDQTPPSAHALTRIAAHADPAVPLVVDGGVRTASHVAVALALGASLVGMGRPVMWALAAGGEEAATRMLTDLRQDLARTLALMGVRSVEELRAEGTLSGPGLPQARLRPAR